MRNAKFWINKTSNQNIEGFTILVEHEKEGKKRKRKFKIKTYRERKKILS